jgi:hypothetical protein
MISGASAAAAGSGVPPKVAKKTYDLNTQADPFLRAYAGVPFPEAVDANEKELAEVIFQFGRCLVCLLLQFVFVNFNICFF